MDDSPAHVGVILEGIRQGYRGRLVIDGLDLTLKRGVTALVGPNGAGKSTLLNTVTTVLPPLGGRLVIKDVVVCGGRSIRQARRHIGFLPQDFGADPHFTVRDFVTYLGWLRELPARELDAAVTRAITAVGLEDRARTRVRKLSGGMRQRAGIAGAIVGDPAVIVLDEPTVGLDPQQRIGFRDVLRGLSDRCVLLSTHLIEDVAAVADRVILMNAGRVRFDGSVEELRERGARTSGTVSDLEEAYVRVIDQVET